MRIYIYQLLDRLGIEIWLPVPPFTKDQLQVSNLGRAKGLKGVLKLTVNNFGYLRIETTVKQRRCRILIHRAIVRAFLGFRGDAKEVDHIDCDKRNNRLVNLIPITRSDNMAKMLNKMLNKRWNKEPGKDEFELCSDEELPF